MVKKQDIKIGIRGKLLLVTGFFMIVFIGIITITNLTIQTSIIKQRLQTKAKSLLSLLEKTSVDPILQLRIDRLRLYLKEVKADPEVVAAYIYDEEGLLLTDGTEVNPNRDQFPKEPYLKKALSTSKRTQVEVGDKLEFVQPIYLSNQRVGSVRIVFTQDLTRKALIQVRNRNLTFGLIFLLMGLVAAYFLARVISKPILELSEKADAIAQGDLDQMVFIESKDELGVLGNSFNQMSLDLRKTTVAKQYVDDILHNMGECLIVFDRAYAIKTVNQAVERLLGWKKYQLIGEPISKILPSDTTLFEDGGLEALAEKKTVKGIETVYRTKEGKDVIVSFSATVMWNRAGKLDGIVSIATDITEQKKMYKEVVDAQKELERSNSDLEQFAYVASHDLQEPLRMVSAYMSLLDKRYKSKLDESAQEFIEFAVNGAERMRSLIQDLLQYSRLGKKKELAQLDVKETTDAALNNLTVRIEETHAKVQVLEMPQVLGDKVTLTQLFQNLIGNALKFQKKGTVPEVEIKATLDEEQSDWIFSVRDNGIGIEEEYREKIFQIFERLNARDEYEGTGIGLAVCKRIVENHNGRIWVESAYGRGTTFYFTIPKLGV